MLRTETFDGVIEEQDIASIKVVVKLESFGQDAFGRFLQQKSDGKDAFVVNQILFLLDDTGLSVQVAGSANSECDLTFDSIDAALFELSTNDYSAVDQDLPVDLRIKCLECMCRVPHATYNPWTFIRQLQSTNYSASDLFSTLQRHYLVDGGYGPNNLQDTYHPYKRSECLRFLHVLGFVDVEVINSGLPIFTVTYDNLAYFFESPTMKDPLVVDSDSCLKPRTTSKKRASSTKKRTSIGPQRVRPRPSSSSATTSRRPSVGVLSMTASSKSPRKEVLSTSVEPSEKTIRFSPLRTETAAPRADTPSPEPTIFASRIEHSVNHDDETADPIPYELLEHQHRRASINVSRLQSRVSELERELVTLKQQYEGKKVILQRLAFDIMKVFF